MYLPTTYLNYIQLASWVDVGPFGIGRWRVLLKQLGIYFQAPIEIWNIYNNIIVL